jgi:hypothetical protein
VVLRKEVEEEDSPVVEESYYCFDGMRTPIVEMMTPKLPTSVYRLRFRQP